MDLKKILGAVALVAVGAVVAPVIVSAQPEALPGIDATLVFQDGLLVDVEQGTTQPPGSTTTQPPGTTTTTAVPPTTTAPPTTTTTAPPPTTTTTQAPPPIGPDPTHIGTGPTASYDIYVIGRLGSPDAVMMWRAPYWRQLSSNAGWDDGDRSAYRAGYGFLHHDPAGPTPDRSIFRFFFAGGYGGTITTQVGDERMNEAERFYDCTRYDVAPPGLPANDARGCGVVGGPATAELRDSPRPNWIGSTEMPPDRRPVLRVVHTATGQVVEVRSYVAPVSLDPGTTFGPLQHITSPFQDQGDAPNPDKPDAYDSGPHTVYERFVVGAWLDGDNAVSVYYDILDPDYHLNITYPLEN